MALIEGQNILPGQPLPRSVELWMPFNNKWVKMTESPSFWSARWERHSSGRSFRWGPSALTEQFWADFTTAQGMILTRSQYLAGIKELQGLISKHLNSVESQWELLVSLSTAETWAKILHPESRDWTVWLKGFGKLLMTGATSSHEIDQMLLHTQPYRYLQNGPLAKALEEIHQVVTSG